MLTHRLLGGGSSSLSVSCPSLGSSRARLWSSFRRRSESPLLTYQETKRQEKSLACSAAPDLFPDSLPASCGFRLCSRRQPQSSPWGLTSEARASAPSPHPPQRVSRQASRAGEGWSAPIFCAGISPLCPLHRCCCPLLCVSEAPPAPSPPVRGLQIGRASCRERV